MSTKNTLPKGVMFNAYPDSLGRDLADTVQMLKQPEFKNAFSLFYILPTIFHSDLDRGFSIIDYDINEELVEPQDLDELNELGIQIKFDLVLNHLSVRSPQFADLLQNGNDSPYRDFFIDWNEFWKGHGAMDDQGVIVPDKEHLDKLFMRKSGLPILKLRFPDGTIKPYWNTFYQKVDFNEITAQDLRCIRRIDQQLASDIANRIKVVIKNQRRLKSINFEDIDHCIECCFDPEETGHCIDSEDIPHCKNCVIGAVYRKHQFLGQMDLNARSELVWDFYDETLRKLSEYGAKIIRLDAFAYLHK
ncbi:MAG: glycosidase, partial [Gammaproteobacteria bacterium]|nr:glycosidase [Gammaproteobacteria bacterium]